MRSKTSAVSARKSLLGLTVLGAILCTAMARGGEPYAPVHLAPGETVLPPTSLVDAASALLQASRSDDRPAIAARLAPQLTLIDGPLELGLPRRIEETGPFETIEQALSVLADNIGGLYERPFDGSDVTPYAVAAERDFIIGSLTDGQAWGYDPLLENAICTYAYRSYDREAISALAQHLDVQSSSFFFVETVTMALAQPKAGAAVAATLEPHFLYGLDYETDAPSGWIAVHLPTGSSGFLDFEKVEIGKPYASGVCFSKDMNKNWVMSAQTATNQ